MRRQEDETALFSDTLYNNIKFIEIFIFEYDYMILKRFMQLVYF